MTEKCWLALILGLFMLLGAVYTVITPVFEASDELWHYPMVRHLADGNPLPVQVFDPALAGPWKQEASQPPLYYALAAAFTFWIDTSDMPQVRWENPHVNNGIITADGNINLTIHDPAWHPWQGTLLAVRLVRLFSVLLGAATVTLTYLIAREVEPYRPEIWLGAAAVNAFLPMFVFISASVNNDNLAIPLASLALLLMIRMVNRRLSVVGNGCSFHRLPLTVYWLHWLLIGVVIGLAVLTKEGTFGLFPIALGTAFISQWQAISVQMSDSRRHHTRPMPTYGVRPYLMTCAKTIFVFLVMMVPVVVIAGWWYGRNLQLYGDFLGWNAFIAVLGQRAHPASLAQLWSERRGFMMAYWGLFGGVNVPMAAWIYTVLNSLLMVSVAGFVGYLGRKIRLWRVEAQGTPLTLPGLLAALLHFVERHFALIVCLLFATAVVVGLVQWATTTWSSQGRLVFTALSALTVLLVVGLAGWLPRRPAGWLMTGIGSFLFVVALLAPFLWIRPSYQPPQFDAPPERMAASFGDALKLVGYEVTPTAVQPGDTVWVTLAWQVMQPIDRSWSIFVHLNDPVLERPIAQRDMYPGQGLRPTPLLQPGERLVTRHLLAVPATAIAPADLALTVGLYDFVSEERLPVTESDLPVQQAAVTLATVSLTAVAGDTPNPLLVRFEKGFELVGYELSPRQAGAGETANLTLYWRLTEAVQADYTFFAQVVDKETTRWASMDLPVPTSQWPLGRPQPVPLALTLQTNTPSEVYPVIIGLYTLSASGEFQRLQRITADGRPTDDFLELTLLRVD